MKIQRKFTTAARGMMAMKKDVAKDVMANLAENGTMFDKDKGKTGRMKMRMKELPKKPKFPTVDPNNPDDPNILNYPDGKFYQDEKGFIKPINRHPDYKKPRSSRRLSGEKGMKYNKARGGMKIQYKMQEGGKNPIAKDEDYTLMYKVDDQKMSGGKEIPETKVTGEEIRNLFQRNKIFPSEERYFEMQLEKLGINEPIKNLVTSGRLESEIKKAKEALAEKKSKDFKKEMMKQVNQPSQDRLKSGEKGMTYKKGPGGMMISFVRKNK